MASLLFGVCQELLTYDKTVKFLLWVFVPISFIFF